jgi:hypothetical protein
MSPAIRIEFRTAVLLLGALLGLQFIWLVSSELSRTNVVQLPTSAAAAAAAAKERDRAALAAAIGLFRGELWAQSAFTYANLLFDRNEKPESVPELGHARNDLERALNDAPVQSPAWLLRAALGLRYPALGFNASEAIKMSYYTGPSELALIPMRLHLAALSGTISDGEMSPFVRRDFRLLLARKQQAAITEAYDAASPSGKRFIEQSLGEIDRSAVEALKATAQKRSLPD